MFFWYLRKLGVGGVGVGWVGGWVGGVGGGGGVGVGWVGGWVGGVGGGGGGVGGWGGLRTPICFWCKSINDKT